MFLRTLTIQAVFIFYSQCFQNCFQNTTSLCTGHADFHKMIITVQKYTFVKAELWVFRYRCYENFENFSR